jgi:hypothetical protein
VKRSVLVTGLVLVLNSCRDQVCTLVGCFDGLTVAVASAPATPFRIEAFVLGGGPRYGQTCSGTPCSVFFPDFTPERVSIERIAGADTVRREFNPTYTLSRPNGPNCSPECRQATVTF